MGQYVDVAPWGNTVKYFEFQSDREQINAS